MNFTEIKAEIADRLNLTSETALARIGRQINVHYRRITASVGLTVARRVIISATATIGSREITFPSVEKVLSVIDRSSGRDRLLKEISYDEMLLKYKGHSAVPNHYAVVRMNSGSVELILDCT